MWHYKETNEWTLRRKIIRETYKILQSDNNDLYCTCTTAEHKNERIWDR